MLCGCVLEKPKIKINLEQDMKWWETLNLSILLLLISSVLKLLFHNLLTKFLVSLVLSLYSAILQGSCQ